MLGYLASEIQRRGAIAIQLDMRTIGSTGGIYSDPKLSIAERATRLLADALSAIHDRILTESVAKAEEYDLSVLGPLLYNFIDADFRSIRRAILDLTPYYESSKKAHQSTPQWNVHW
ncbi:MAG: hypothetical protein ACKVQU_04040 [Burkholderiales bacterium]